MRRWMKWTLLVAMMAVPALGYAVTRSADGGCPIDCPCPHR